MKYKLSVIFFLLCLILFIIYNKFDERELNILYIGDSRTFEILNFELEGYKLNKYLFDNVTYKEIKNNINNNSYKIVKEKYVYLNREIGKSDVIIFNANNFEYKLKCSRTSRIVEEYNMKVNNDVDDLVKYLNSMVNSKIIIIGNHCGSYNFNLKENGYVFIDYDNISNIDKFI
jgi:hypothetical protein